MRSRLRYFYGLMLPLVFVTLHAAGSPGSLIEAVKSANIAAVRGLLQQHVNVNAQEPDGSTALHWATQQDQGELARLLIGAGADVSITNRYGVTPLYLACLNGNAALVKTFLDAGAKPDAALPEGETALMTAARTGNPDIVKTLLDRGADANAKEHWRGQTALMWAASEGHVSAIQTLLEGGADLKARSKGGYTAFLFAVRAGKADAVRTLMAAGADVDEVLLVPQAPGRGAADATKAAQAAPPRVGPEDPDQALIGMHDGTAVNGTNPLVLAVMNGHFELAALLLDKGADPNADAQGWTALHQLAWFRRPPMQKGLPTPDITGNLDSIGLAKALIAHGANPNARLKREPNDGARTFRDSRIGATAYYLAARLADPEFMQFLAANGADTKTRTDRGNTVLMAAAGLGIWKFGENAGTNEEAFEATKLAWDLGSTDINAQDASGDTALHGAAIRGANPIIEFLVSKGANVDLRNKIGWTPLTVTEGIKYPNTFTQWPESAALLYKLGAKDPGVRRPEDVPVLEVVGGAARSIVKRP